MRVTLALAAATALLGACSDQASDKETARPSASASDIPAPRAGLWEQTMSSPGNPAGATFRVCVGEPDPEDNPFAFSQGDDVECSQRDFRRVAGGVEFETRCTSQGMTVASKGRITGDLNSAYEGVVTSTMSGEALPQGMPAEMSLAVKARRLGDCPAGVEPGTLLPEG